MFKAWALLFHSKVGAFSPWLWHGRYGSALKDIMAWNKLVSGRDMYLGRSIIVDKPKPKEVGEDQAAKSRDFGKVKGEEEAACVQLSRTSANGNTYGNERRNAAPSLLGVSNVDC